MRCSILMVVLFLSVGCGRDLSLDSCWRATDVTIDGDNNEWGECVTYIEDKDLAVGVMNDDEFVYVLLTTADREVQRQVTLSGLTVWLDVANDKKKDFGIRFPLGVRGGDPPERIREMTERPDPAEMLKRLEERIASMKEFEVIGPHAGNLRLMDMSETNTIAVALSQIKGTFVYELKMPLRRETDYLYGLGVDPGVTIGIGLESPEFKVGNLRERMGGEMRGGGPLGGVPGGGGGGRRGGGPPGMGGMRPGGGAVDRPDPFDVWATVQLATGSDITSD
ncbi:MAG: hypothetical protein JSW58_05535 [Candidatus Latescibacterota bacterium]|nr:MAG: hypothetical protein JSW58_05535 [Candidatus Latescibacterota bacterium]